jgi:YVTN family beta-propeller protein
MDVHLLGPVEVRVDGKPLGLGATKQRALLVLLALEAGRAVSSERIAAGLWGEDIPSSAHKMVQQYVSQLRRLLDGDAAEIVTRGRGYELRLGGGETDVARFEWLVTDRPRDALRLWRGAPLADVADEPFTAAEIRRLEELRLHALERAVELDLAAGRHRDVLPELDALVAEHPLSETLHAQRMLALYRAGRQVDALRAYREARAVLVEQAGVEPGPELRALHERILRQDSGLAPAPASIAAAPRGPTAPAAPHDPARPPPVPRRGRRRLAVVAATAAAAAVAVAAFALSRGTDAAQIGADRVARLGADGEVEARYSVGRAPGAIVAGGGSIWVGSELDRTVTRIDAANDRATTIDVGAEPVGLAYGGGSLWVADGSGGRVARVDPRTNRVVQRIALPNVSRAIAAGHGSIWVASAVGGVITRIDLERGRILAPLRVGGSPTALAAGAATLWAASESEGTVTEIDLRSGTAVRSIAVGGSPAAIAVGGGAVWVANRADGTVSRIDPERGVVTETVAVGRGPVAVAAGDDAVWVANAQDGTLARIDPQTRRVTRTVDAGGGPSGAAFDGDQAWAAAGADVATHRGGTLRFSGTQREAAWVLDPASPDSYEMGSQAVLTLLYDGLVAYRRVGGVAGAQIVADLAESVPRPGDGGRTYLFRLRRGLQYADGRPVRASDFRATLERGLRVNQGAREAYAVLRGAASCSRERCDLSAGIDVDDAARTVVIRLRRPDPELLHRLALPFAAVLPDGGPGARDRPPPGTGPYVLEGDRLVRNRRFRSWSSDARPTAFADAILLQPAHPGDADVRVGFAPQDPAEIRALTTRYGGRLGADPTLLSQWLFLNARKPPFDDARVRQAVNFAVDRQRIVELIGGDAAAQVTCRILPLGLAGHRSACPFTAGGPGAAGWQGPHVVRARQLVRASGTHGMPVELWVDEGFGPIGPYLRDVLRELGYRARLRVFQDTGTYFERLARARPDAGIIGWIGDTLASSNFIVPNFTCAGDLNHSGVCDRRLDALVARAYRAPDPATADVLWDRVERRLSILAPAVPLLHGRRLTILSDRAGNVQNHPLWGPLLDQVWVR